MGQPAVEVVDLVKRYPKAARNAVDGVSFEVDPGEVFGLLGPNGAGKTTTVGVLTTRVVPTSGTARVAGLDVRADSVAVCARLAVVPQRQNLDRSLGVRDNLVFHAAYHGVGRAERNRRADELLDRMGLADKAKAIADDLSGGQAQRVMIARALMHRPEVLFLDEPSTGLDPQARLFVHDHIRALREEGITVVLTTHDMDEAHKLSDRIGIVDHGKLLALDTPDALVRSLPGSATVEIVAEPGPAGAGPLRDALSALDGVARIETPPGRGDTGTEAFRLSVTCQPATLLAPVVDLLGRHGAAAHEVSLGEATLEDVFIDLTGRDLR
ncbi:ABC transporter ATP-binding protein [Pseudonocardia parietis]|uniref:ABC-2 type transport system ATP-binding protein n=1 Tax=Pseudonocardia parietis TaxID=570936 RepID=A0ABS4VQ25_9PSEU|nr:ABC transporter ATP-binding protein [Pseudonocardia parietis]MBP2366033.1 ABC-2 type transport system ATP-binding protein [Pseudonocardia parietis]